MGEFVKEPETGMYFPKNPSGRSLYERWGMKILNSKACKERTPEDQEKVRQYVQSQGFETEMNGLEEGIKNLSIDSLDKGLDWDDKALNRGFDNSDF